MFLELIERLEALETDNADPEAYLVEVYCSLVNSALRLFENSSASITAGKI